MSAEGDGSGEVRLLDVDLYDLLLLSCDGDLSESDLSVLVGLEDDGVVLRLHGIGCSVGVGGQDVLPVLCQGVVRSGQGQVLLGDGDGVSDIQDVSGVGDGASGGLDLSVVPKLALTYEGGFNWYLLIPLLCVVFQFAQTFYMQKKNPVQEGAGAMGIMLYMFPLLSAYICFVVPAGAGFYWVISAIAMLIQSVFLNIKYNPKKMAEQAQAEMDANKEKKRQQRVEARERLKELQQNKGEKSDKASGEEISMSQKEENRRKLAAARKRDAEKYGEEYVEVTDDDLK
mgnify:CR=1 FL=1